VAALFGVLGSGVGAAGTSVGLAAVNGAFGGNVTDWNAIFENPENLSPENRQELDKLRNLLGLQEGSNEDGIDADAINTILVCKKTHGDTFWLIYKLFFQSQLG